MKVSELIGTFQATATLSPTALSYEDRPKIIENLRSYYEFKGFDVNIDYSKGIIYPVGLCIYHRLPKLERVRYGHILFRSKTYEFSWVDSNGVQQTSYGNKPKSDCMLKNGFYIKMLDGNTITYHLKRG